MNQAIPRLWIASSIALGCLVTFSPSQAQIVPDNTLPVNSSVTPVCTVCTIEGGTVRGANLFHSFSEFSVPTGGEALFNNALQIEKIFSRVTGSNISNIDGLIRANGTANLFLLNPNGIIFGAGARLDIGGSFLATTASSFKFPDGSKFSATNPTAPPLLTISVPMGLQFGGTPNQIVVQGSSLTVQQQKTLALLGRDVTIAGGTLKAPTGRIELGSVTGQGQVSLTPTGTGIALGYDGVSSFGDIQLSQAALVDISSDVGGGDIQVQSRRFTLTDGSRFYSFNWGSQPGGTITVNASESVELAGTGTYVQDVQRFAIGQLYPANLQNGLFSVSFGTGAASNIKINTPSFVARNGAFVLSSTFGQGQGGN
jgi:filamentous hemagglutinin family protein